MEDQDHLELLDFGTIKDGKLHIVQEMVVGKQVTLAHILAHPDNVIYQKLGINPDLDDPKCAIAILSMLPAEISVIAADVAVKAAEVEAGFVDRFTGTLTFSGRTANVEKALVSVLAYLKHHLGFVICEITRT